jgi:hypothetical protein
VGVRPEPFGEFSQYLTAAQAHPRRSQTVAVRERSPPR